MDTWYRLFRIFTVRKFYACETEQWKIPCVDKAWVSSRNRSSEWWISKLKSSPNITFMKIKKRIEIIGWRWKWQPEWERVRWMWQVERNWRGVNSGGGNQVGVKKNLDGGECQNEGRNSGAGGVVVKDSVTIGERKKTVEMCAPNQLWVCRYSCVILMFWAVRSLVPWDKRQYFLEWNMYWLDSFKFWLRIIVYFSEHFDNFFFTYHVLGTLTPHYVTSPLFTVVYSSILSLHSKPCSYMIWNRGDSVQSLAHYVSPVWRAPFGVHVAANSGVKTPSEVDLEASNCQDETYWSKSRNETFQVSREPPPFLFVMWPCMETSATLRCQLTSSRGQ